MLNQNYHVSNIYSVTSSYTYKHFYSLRMSSYLPYYIKAHMCIAKVKIDTDRRASGGNLSILMRKTSQYISLHRLFLVFMYCPPESVELKWFHIEYADGMFFIGRIFFLHRFYFNDICTQYIYIFFA